MKPSDLSTGGHVMLTLSTLAVPVLVIVIAAFVLGTAVRIPRMIRVVYHWWTGIRFQRAGVGYTLNLGGMVTNVTEITTPMIECRVKVRIQIGRESIELPEYHKTSLAHTIKKTVLFPLTSLPQDGESVRVTIDVRPRWWFQARARRFERYTRLELY